MKITSFIVFLGISLFFLCLVHPVSADIIFRGSVGNWYLDSNNDGIVDASFHFGTDGDIPVTGDWNNDGISDVGVFRPSTGNWYLETAKNSSIYRSFHFGTAGDIPVIGDWNNDGISDVGVFRPSTGNWYLETAKNSSIYRSFHFGTAGDIPVIGDWNNDGISDVGVFRPSTGNWYLDLTKTGVVTQSFHFGTAGDIPVIGDWNNDGISDVGVFRPSTGNWYLDLTKTGVVNTSFHFGTTGDIPVIGDWNNDGISDVGVFRPSNGNWYLDTTKTGVVTQTFHFGTTGDKPSSFQSPPARTFAPFADFSADVRSGPAPLMVSFTDNSTGSTPMTYAWDFGDGGSSEDQNPTHTYTTPGTYTVSITATNSAGTNVATQTGYITVTQGQSGGSQTGIALTFDDAYIDQWYGMRDILKKYNAHATFFVAYYYSLSPDQITELKMLESDGNEIAYHGYNHLNEIDYLQNHTLDNYLNNEIINGVTLMKNDGFNPVSFAYPYGYYDPNATQSLEKYFNHMRATSYDWSDPLIYYQYGSHQAIIYGIGIDDITYNETKDINTIYNGISTAKNDNKILILYGHQTVTNASAAYETSYDRIDKILHYASINNMKTFTISEIN